MWHHYSEWKYWAIFARRRECDCLGSRTLKTASPAKAFDRSSRPRTRLDESGAAICNSYRFDGHTPTTNTRGSTRRQVVFFTYLGLYMVSLNLPFCTTTFHLSSSLLQMTIVLHPSRIRHNRDTGADVQQGPISRILFRLRPCVNLFLLSLVAIIPWFFTITRMETDILASAVSEDLARTWTLGA